MESKKINQLATNVAPQTSDLTIIGDPITGVSKKITLLQIANLFATTGTVSSVAVTETGDALTITGSPITSTGTINIGFAGDATQYVRGDGALADFPTSTGGGSSVSYYLNSSVSQGTIGGVAYRELSKDPISGAGTDITISANGYVASYITDANDPALLEVPGGNFNCEFYFSVNSNNHDPYVYAELYKYDGSTFTLLGSSQSVPEYLTNGTTLSPYYFAIPVATAALTITDRLAIRIYVNVDGRVVTLHTENNHLCQVVTTFSKGLISLNNLTRQNQFFATGTSGTDFAISSSVATHTFNLPVASATNTGKLSSTDWSTFNGKVPYTGATGSVDLGVYNLTAFGVSAKAIEVTGNGTQGGYLYIKQGILPFGTSLGSNAITADGTKYVLIANVDASNNKIALLELGSLTNNTQRTFTLPDLSGTLALLEGTQTFTGVKTFDEGISLKSAAFPTPATGYSSIGGNSFGITIITKQSSTIYTSNLGFPAANRTFTFPNSDGTIALTSNLSSYVPYSGATGAVDLGTNSFTAGSSITINGVGSTGGALVFKQLSATSTNGGPSTTGISALGSTQLFISYSDSSSNYRNIVFDSNLISNNSVRYFSFPNASGTLALTSDLSAYLPLAGGTLTGALSGTSATFSGLVTIDKTNGGEILLKTAGSNYGLFSTTFGISGSGSNTDLNAFVYGVNSFGVWTNSTKRLTIDGAGAATFSSSVTANGAGSASSGTINLVSSDSFIRLNTTGGTVDKGKWDIRCISATGSEALEFRTINDANNVFSTKVWFAHSGSVGIGTSSPAYRLHVSSTASEVMRLQGTSGGGSNNTQLRFYGSASAADLWAIGTEVSTGSSDRAFDFYDLVAAANRMRITSAGNTQPGIDNAYSLGVSGTRWSAVWAANGTIQTSDEREKKDIVECDLGLDFVSKLRPVSYKWIVGKNVATSEIVKDEEGNPILDEDGKEKTESIITPIEGKRTHYGLIAQEVEALLDGKDFGGFIHDEETDIKGLRYDQFVPLLIKSIQELQAKIVTLESKIN